jgi:pyridoxal phosphate enzyme (YggS family)
MTSLSQNISVFLDHFNQLKAGRPLTLVAVSKTQSADVVREAFHCGLPIFGENYVQEAIDKQALLQDLPIEWHFIGPLQSNKTKLVAEHFSWVHSIDRLKLAERLSAQRAMDLPPIQICIQVNVSGEASKSGVNPNETLALAQAISVLPQLQLRGLMAIPEPSEDETLLRSRFAQLKVLKNQIEKAGIPLDTLSMGMSADYAIAMEEGSNLIRVGSALFGSRSPKPHPQ